MKPEDERWKEERDRKLKEERSRSKDSVPKEDGKESTFSSLPPVTRISVVKVTD